MPGKIRILLPTKAEPFLVKADTMEIEDPVNNAKNQVNLKSSTVVKMTLVGGYLPTQLQLVTSMLERAI